MSKYATKLEVLEFLAEAVSRGYVGGLCSALDDIDGDRGGSYYGHIEIPYASRNMTDRIRKLLRDEGRRRKGPGYTLADDYIWPEWTGSRGARYKWLKGQIKKEEGMYPALKWRKK